MTTGHRNMNKSIYIQLKCSDVFRRCKELYKNADPYVKALYSLALRSYAYLIDFGFFLSGYQLSFLAVWHTCL